ncbi:MAG: hypothetical protein FJW97_09705 [Actinobacteria bacterium]|nr:hypothetical protein [Actinomycetota bacterium]
MRFDSGVTYMMPVSFGSQPPHPAGEFTDVQTLMVTYRSTKEALRLVLPEPFEPGPEPLVFVYMQRCRGVNFLAGGEYRLLGVNVAATFPSSGGPILGSYALILWEDNIEAIIRGREILGIPKLLAEVDDPEPQGGEFSVAARDRGRELIRINLVDELELSEPQVEQLRVELATNAWFGWKRIPRVDGVGVEVSHATRIGILNKPSQAWACRGSVAIGNVSWEESPSNAHIVQGLRQLPLIDVVRAYRTQGTVTLTRADHRVMT